MTDTVAPNVVACRFSQVEKLLPKEKRKPIVQLMDAFLKSAKA